jgi:GNAT superfamily N-acetyltransferase
MTTRLRVRPATTDDLPAIAGLAVAQSREIYPDLPIDSDAITALASWLLADPSRGMLAVVADEAGALYGMLGASVTTHPMTGERTATELCWFIRPEARGGSAAWRLLTQYETWARQCGAVRVQMSAPAGLSGAAYQHRGYQPREMTYDKRLAAHAD